MVVQDLSFLFDMLDAELRGYLTSDQIHLFDESVNFDALDLEQVEAAIDTVCGHNADGKCEKGHFEDLLKELERRRELEEKVKWDFKALDLENKGRISPDSTLFLMKSVHGDSFSVRQWNAFLSSRIRPEADVSYSEIRMLLCNLPKYDASNDDEYFELLSETSEREKSKNYDVYNSLLAWREDENAIVEKEMARQLRSDRLKNSADYLLDRLDDIGMQALLEEDTWDETGYGGRPRERVSATELLEYLKEKYDALRENLLAEMLKIQVGEGMWAAFPEKEQHDRLLQLKVKEEKLRRDGKLETMAPSLPGARHQFNYSLLWAMGESQADSDKRSKAMKEKEKESGLSQEDVQEEFIKQLYNKEKQSLTSDQFLVALNEREALERERLSSMLQGLSMYSTMTAGEREITLGQLLLMKIRAVHERQFHSGTITVGLVERMLGHHDRSDKEAERQEKLARDRLAYRKGRKFQEEKQFHEVVNLRKSLLGRVDLQLDLVQEMERRLTLEREFLIQVLQGKDSVHHRIAARKLSHGEKSNQLLVLKTQWQGWRDRSREEKMSTLEQHRALLQEGVAIAFESRKEEARLMSSKPVDDLDIAATLLAELQKEQDLECRNLLEFADKDKQELIRIRDQQKKGTVEEWFDNIAAVILGIKDVSDKEEEIIRALEDKYDALRDKLLLEAMKKQLGDAEWALLSEQERQARLTKMKLLEKRLRREGKYDEAAKLLGDAMKDADFLQNLMGENRQRYLDKLQERLKNRKKKISDAEYDEEEEEEGLDEDLSETSGNVLLDLQKRFEKEKEALLRRLQEGEDRFLNEQERQAELIRLKLEKRKAERESNFEGAALVLGLAERNQAAREEQLKQDRERQERLARERIEARRKQKRRKTEEQEDPEPAKDDLSGWQDAVMKELEKKHKQERDFLIELLQDPEADDLRDEVREMSDEEKQERLAKLKSKREELDFEVKADQEEHGAVLEMAAAVKVIIRQVIMAKAKGEGISPEDISIDDVTVSILADLQQAQDRENEEMMITVNEKTVEDLVPLRQRELEARKYEEMTNVAAVIFKFEGEGTDDQLVKALDKKYDALMDKLLLESLQKQLGEAEWARLSEQERQARALKLRLEQKRLMREGRLDEAAKLLGEGFETEANLKKLMGQNRARYEEMLKEKLARKRERLARGEPVDEEEEAQLEAELEGLQQEDNARMDARTLLENMQKRYEDEKEALMARLMGADEKFMSERERQSELARLRREQRRAQQEEKFDAAALVLGLAERNQAAAEKRLKSDRERQEQLARERLERMRAKRQKKQGEVPIVKDGDLVQLQEAVMKHVENRHSVERQALLEYLQKENSESIKVAKTMTQGNREARLEELKEKFLSLEIEEKKQSSGILQEMAALKIVTRQHKLETDNDGVPTSKDDVIVSIMADLQQQQDQESERVLKEIVEKNLDELVGLQEHQVKLVSHEKWNNIGVVLGTMEKTKEANEDVLVDALQSKYDSLQDKLILEALEKQMGTEKWEKLSDDEKQASLMKIKMEIKRLQDEGKTDELNKYLAELFPDDSDLNLLLGDTVENQQERERQKEEKRRLRRQQGMSEEAIARLEEEEEKEYQEQLKKKSKGNAFLDLQKNFEDEKNALLAAMRGANARLLSERERQAELARLRREQRKIKREEKFDSAALVIGLAKSNQAKLDAKLKSDRARQEQLARERLLARRNLRDKKLAEKQQQDEEPLQDTNDVMVLQEEVLGELEKKHSSERDVLLEILQESVSNEWRAKAKQMDDARRDQRLLELTELRNQWRDSSPAEMEETAEEQIEYFKEAASLKIEKILAELKSKSDTGKEVTDEDVSVKIMADLQENQDQEAQYLMKDLASKTPQTLNQLRMVQNVARKGKWYDNVAAALLGIKRSQGERVHTTDDDIVDALEQKYDALKEKVLLEVLKRQFGEEEWEKMSEKERQEHLAKLKAQTRKGSTAANSTLSGISMTSIDSAMGKKRSIKEKKLKAKMERRKRARELGITEEELIAQEGAQEEEEVEEKVSGADVLNDLESQFEAEKDALLAALRGADAKLMSERERQLHLAKLRREQRKIKREEKFDNAAIVFNLAQQHKKQVEATYEAERTRQEELARERLAARRKKVQEAKLSKEEEILKQQLEDANEDILKADQIQREGTVAVQDSVLEEMEKKHQSELQLLMEILQAAETDKEGSAAAAYMTEAQREEKLSRLRNDREKWKEEILAAAAGLPPESEMTEEEKKAAAVRVAAEQKKLAEILKDGLVIRMESKKQVLIGKGYPDESLSEEVSIIVLADLQEKQMSETNAMTSILAEQDRDMLTKLKDNQRRFRRIGVADNVAAAILGTIPASRKRSSSKPPDFAELGEEEEEEEERLQEEEEKKLAELEAEMEKEKERKKLQGLSDDEVQSMMAELQRQEETKRKAIQASIERQREIARQRLEAKRRKKDEKQYEQDMAASIIQAANTNFKTMKDKTSALRDQQKGSLEDRLRQRREARKKRAEEEARLAAEEEAAEAERKKQEEVKKKAPMPPLPGGGLRREKTVVDQAADMEESTKKEIMGNLIKEQHNIVRKMQREQTRNEEMVKYLKLKKRQRLEQREQEAAAIIGIGERQKTIVEKAQKEERERQIASIRERVARIKYERTMTMKEPKDPNAVGFESVLNPDEAKGLSEDEKMARIAKEMEKKFKSEAQQRPSTSNIPDAEKLERPPEFNEERRQHNLHSKLDDKAREQILKERLAQKKKSRKNKDKAEGASETHVEDGGENVNQ